MADTKETAAKQLREITECPICMNVFMDPRILPCIHTFCLECLKRISETAKKDPGDMLPCPLCRKEFLIPADGINGVPKNFFLENLLQYKMTLQVGSATITCDVCSASELIKTGQVPTAAMRCLECQDNYCDDCVKVHQFLKISRDHKLVKIGDDTESSGIKRVYSVKYCSEHTQKPLEYYCAECRKIVCVSCFVERHKSHDCKDIATVDEDFRKIIEKNAQKISNYAGEMRVIRESIEKRKADFLEEAVEKENEIHERNLELKEMIDRDTKLLLDELSAAKSNQLKKMEDEMEITDRNFTIFKGFEAYSTELVSKGSASDICSSYDELILRADGMGKDYEAFIGRPRKSVEVTFETTDLRELAQKFNNNVVGIIRETTSHLENRAIVVGLYNAGSLSNDVIKINLRCPNEVSTEEEMLGNVPIETVAVAHRNTIYVTGIGTNKDEIWKYNVFSVWRKCASLVQGRCRHGAVIIDGVLYICGGYVESNQNVLDSVEAYNAVTGECKTVGSLVHCVYNIGNCVSFRGSWYIFGGSDNANNELNYVQVYNTKENTCSVLSTPMPVPNSEKRAALWKTSVILLGYDICFIFNLETKTWQRRNQFKTDVFHFGLVLDNDRVFVMGGGIPEKDKDGKRTTKYRDDIRYIPVQNVLDDKPIEWKFHAKLPKPSLVRVYSVARF